MNPDNTNNYIKPDEEKQIMDMIGMTGMGGMDSLNIPVKEQILKDVVEALFDKDKIRMISILNKDQIDKVWKFVIIDELVYKTFMYEDMLDKSSKSHIAFREDIYNLLNHAIDETFEKDEKKKKQLKEHVAMLDMMKKYERLNRHRLELTISLRGEGRRNLVSIYGGTDRKLKEEEGLMRKLKKAFF